MAEKQFAWEPYGDYLDSRIARFMKKHEIKTWQELIHRSQDLDWFWPAALEDLGIEWLRPYRKLCDDSRGMPWTKWFVGGKTNIVHNCLDRHMREGNANDTALFFETDYGQSYRVTYGELNALVIAAALGMKRMGIKKGDVVGMCMSVSYNAVIVMLATLKIGAICMQIATRSAKEEVVECLNRGRAKALFIDGVYFRAGKHFFLRNTIEAVSARVRSLKNIVIVSRDLGNQVLERADSFNIPGNRILDYYSDVMLPILVEFGGKRKNFIRAVKTEKLDAEHPALILFSSGTTGKSKAIIHTHGGALAQVTKEVGYAFDCRRRDVFYWFTNFGWMMAPWEVIGALFFGASLVLYEGTHLHPSPHRIFELIEKYKVSIFGFTPTAMRGLSKSGADFSRHDLSTLRILGSTGEPLDPATWQWFFETFGKGKLPIMNISGGTELIGCFLSPLPVMPQNPGSLGGPGLGMDVDIFNGELVCKKPFPSMTRGFLGEGRRYLDTYFSKGTDLWLHGDRAEIRDDGLWYILGRSDDLIVCGGVKHDPAKIEASLISSVSSLGVLEAAAVGARDDLRGQKIVCFVVLGSETGSHFDEIEFKKKLRAHIGRVYDPLGRPDEGDIHIVSALPKNLAAKIPRKLIRKVYEGDDSVDTSKIDNPEAFEAISKAGKK